MCIDHADIFHAAIKGKPNLIKELDSISYNIGLTPLHFACLYGHSDVVNHLLNLGHDVNVHGSISPNFKDDLMVYLEETNAEKAHFPNIDIEADDGFTPMHLVNVKFPKDEEACKKQTERSKIISLLANKGASIRQKTLNYEIEPIHLACMSGLDECVKHLHRYGANLMTSDIKSRTPAFLSVKHDHPRVVRVLMDLGIDFDIARCGEYSLLHLAVDMGHTDVVKLLLAHGIDINQKNKHQENTPLILASKRGDLKTMEVLIDSGAEINLTDIHGRTPLHFASAQGRGDLVRFLLERKASPHLQDRDGKYPKEYADESLKTEFQELW